MTSVLPEEQSNVTRLQQKSQIHNTQGIHKSCARLSTHEIRSFLNFSRENLSISNSEFEQDFNKQPRLSYCTRQTLLSCAALLLALSCTGLELWKLKRVVAVARDVEALKRDVETLKHRLLEEDLLDELKAFEEQLYSEDQSGDEDTSSSISSDNVNDYDSSYDESSATILSAANYDTVTSVSKDLSGGKFGNIGTVSPVVMAPCTSKDLQEVLEVLRRAENRHDQHLEQSFQQGERLSEEDKMNEQRKLIGQLHRSSSGGEKSKRQVMESNKLRRRDFYADICLG